MNLYHSDENVAKETGSWAHLTHGSPPEVAPGKPKFKLVVCPALDAPEVSEQNVIAAGLHWANHEQVMAQFGFDPHTPVGFYRELYFGGNPAKGMWECED